MKRAIILLAVCGLTTGAGAQTMYDALRYSEYDYYGTARTMAMGNAFTALGGDLGGIMINPAGSAVAGYSQVALTPSVNIAVNNAQGTYFNGEPNGFERQTRRSAARFTLPSIGFTLNLETHRTRGLKNVSIGFVASGASYFNDNLRASGSNASTSFMGALAYNTSGWDISELTISDPFRNSYAPWESIVGWEAGLISLYGPDSNTSEYIGTSEAYEFLGGDPNNLSNYSISQAGTLDQQYGRSVRGSRYEYLINMGMNFSDKFYFGFNIGITSLDYSYQDWIMEAAQNPSDFSLTFNNADGSVSETEFSDMNFNYRYNATGVGVYGKFGFIARPVAGLRVGGAIQTPTSTVIKEFWSYSAASYYTDSRFNAGSQSPEGEYRYRLVSPFRFNVGLAYTFGNFGLISADYEMCDYSGMRFRVTENDSESTFDADNADIREFMGASHMLRAGIEVKPLAALSVRAGYGLTTSPERYYEDNVKKAVKANKNSFSAGLGYSSAGSFFADLAFRATRYPDEYVYPYSDYIFDSEGGYFPSPEILNRKWMYDVVLTIGFRF